MAVRNEREKRDYERNENSTRTYFRMNSYAFVVLGAALYCVVVGIIRDMCLVMMMGCAILLTLYIQD